MNIIANKIMHHTLSVKLMMNAFIQQQLQKWCVYHYNSALI